jgi:hypothetical protein
MPYVMVLPITGNQWKTTGGSLEFLNTIWCRTLRKTEKKRRPANTTPTCDTTDSCDSCWDRGPEMFCRKPMLGSEV